MTLQLLNTIAVATTPTQLVPPSTGHWNVLIVNTSGGSVGIGNNNTVAPGAATSFTLPAGGSFTANAVSAPGGLWVAAAAAGSISVALIAR